MFLKSPFEGQSLRNFRLGSGGIDGIPNVKFTFYYSEVFRYAHKDEETILAYVIPHIKGKNPKIIFEFSRGNYAKLLDEGGYSKDLVYIIQRYVNSNRGIFWQLAENRVRTFAYDIPKIYV